jgi:FixJ family two-component response regulator
MPRSDGLDVLSWLGERRPALPVVLVTAFGGTRLADEAQRRGAFGYLEKPFHIAAILDVIAAVERFGPARDETAGA